MGGRWDWRPLDAIAIIYAVVTSILLATGAIWDIGITL